MKTFQFYRASHRSLKLKRDKTILPWVSTVFWRPDKYQSESQIKNPRETEPTKNSNEGYGGPKTNIPTYLLVFPCCSYILACPGRSWVSYLCAGVPSKELHICSLRIRFETGDEGAFHRSKGVRAACGKSGIHQGLCHTPCSCWELISHSKASSLQNTCNTHNPGWIQLIT